MVERGSLRAFDTKKWTEVFGKERRVSTKKKRVASGSNNVEKDADVGACEVWSKRRRHLTSLPLGLPKVERELLRHNYLARA